MSISSITPAFTYEAFALPFSPPSSAGHPNTTTFPPTWSMTCLSAIPANTLAVPMILWPHAWPKPGKASYSAKYPIVGPSFSDW